MDIAVNLVESYLRLNGYFTLSEFEVQRRGGDGRFTTVTDVDIMAVRTPDTAGSRLEADDEMLILEDPALILEPDTVDVIIGEVKQGPAELNPGTKDRGVLHTMVSRIAWLYATELPGVVDGLQSAMVHRAPARGGGTVRTRLVAFGRNPDSNLNVISIGHIVTTLLGFFGEHSDAFRPAQFRDPAPAFLHLLLKAGFDITK